MITCGAYQCRAQFQPADAHWCNRLACTVCAGCKLKYDGDPRIGDSPICVDCGEPVRFARAHMLNGRCVVCRRGESDGPRDDR